MAVPVDGALAIDLDSDGSSDVTIRAGTGWVTLEASVVGHDSPEGLPIGDRLRPGDSISPSNVFVEPTSWNFETFYVGLSPAGGWSSGEDGYAGIRFQHGGQTQFAWVHLRIPSIDEDAVRVLGWAYEARPGEPILAGDTGDAPCEPAFEGRAREVRLAEGSVVVLQAVATGRDLRYHWRRDGIPLDEGDGVWGTRTPFLTVQGRRSSNGAQYVAHVEGPCGAADSPPVTIPVMPDCAPFTGSALHASYALIPGFSPPRDQGGLTVEFWVSLDHGEFFVVNLFDLDPFTFPSRFALSRYFFGMTAARVDGEEIDFDLPEFTPTAWHHLALTRDSNRTVKLYFDGRLAGTGVAGLTPPDDSTDLWIGASNAPWGQFPGRMDEFRIWDHARSHAEIRDGMTRQYGAGTAGLLLAHRFDSTDGGTLMDSSGNGHTGTLMDAASLSDVRACCPGDFNADDFLDFFDDLSFVTCFEEGRCPPGRTADFNGDGFVDFFDYDAFIAAFESGC